MGSSTGRLRKNCNDDGEFVIDYIYYIHPLVPANVVATNNVGIGANFRFLQAF